MTPEQLQQYVEGALKQRDQFSFVFYPVVVLLSIGGAWLFSYLREKGKNLATKEDVAVITRLVESIKSELASKQHFSRLRYEREIEIYREVWRKLYLFYEAAESLPVGKSQETADSVKCLEARNDLILVIRENRPFYPKEIWGELLLFQRLCEKLSFAKGNAGRLRDDQLDQLMNLPEQAKEHLQNIEEAIRTRLGKFDSV